MGNIKVMGILSLDLSLQSTGFAYCGRDGYHSGTIKPKDMFGAERLLYIRNSISGLVHRVDAHNFNKGIHLISLEGYSMGSPKAAGRAFDIGELGGVVKLLAYELGITILLVPPSSLKLFVTGNGNSNKQRMAEAIAEKYGYGFSQEDEADAFGLLKLAEAYVADRGRKSAGWRRALDGCSILKV